jgi:hypothetical protein
MLSLLQNISNNYIFQKNCSNKFFITLIPIMMKQIRNITTAVLLSVMAGTFSACGTDPVAVATSLTTKGTFTATVGGQAFTANVASANNNTGTISILGNLVSTTGTTSNTKQLSIVGKIASTGTYSLGVGGAISGNAISAAYSEITATGTTVSSSIIYGATSGQLVITELSTTKVSGTVSFTGVETSTGKSITVSSGAFNVNF